MIDLSQPLPFGIGRRNWPQFAAGAVVILAIIWWFDHPLSVLVYGREQPVLEFFSAVTRWGESDWILIPSFALLVVSALLVRLIPGRIPKLALVEIVQMCAFIFIGVGVPGLLANLLKRVIGRARPDIFDSVGTFSFHSIANNYDFESFPSGHTTTAFGLAMILGFLSPRWFGIGLIYAMAIAASRLIIGAHYPTDVFGGMMLGVLGAYATRAYFASRRWGFERLQDGRIVRRPAVAVQRLVRPRQRLPAK